MYLINVLTMLLVMITFQVDKSQSVDYSAENQIEMLKLTPSFEVSHVTTESEKTLSKSNYIAQEFFAIVLIAESHIEQVPYLHYESVYKLHRKKDFFLLI